MESTAIQEAVDQFREQGHMNDRLLKATEIATFLGCSKSRAHELMADGTLPAIRIGRSIRVSKRSLERWIREQEEKARQNVA